MVIDSPYGLLIVLYQQRLSDKERRLFRKKRQQLMKRVKLAKVVSGVYLIPFENPKPTEDEIGDFEEFQDLINKFHLKVGYFAVTRVEPKSITEMPEGIIRLKDVEFYFVLEPIKIRYLKS